MIKKVFLLVLLISVVLPSLVSAYPGSSIGSSYGSSIGSSYGSIGSSYGSSLPSSRMEYDSYMNTQKMAYNSYQNDAKIQKMQYDSNKALQDSNMRMQQVQNDASLDLMKSQMQARMNADQYRQNQIATQSVSRNSLGGLGSGSGGSYAPSAPTAPAPDVAKLIAQMNEELKLAKSDYNLVSEDVLKLKNRNSLENLKISFFGGDPNLASSIQQNIANSNNHFSRIYTLNSQCNCIDKSGSIIKEADSMRTTLISKSNQAEAEKENKGIVGKIMNTISNSQKGRL